MPISTLIVTWLILTEVSALSAIAVLPYAAALKGRGISAGSVARVLIASHFVFGLTSAVGLGLGRRFGFGAPLMEAYLSGHPVFISSVAVLTWCVAGVVSAAILWVLDVVFFFQRAHSACQI